MGRTELLRQFRAQDELPEPALLEPAVCLGDLVERNPLGDARPNVATCQEADEALEVLLEPGGMECAQDAIEKKKARLPPGSHLQRYRRAIHPSMVSMRRFSWTPAE